MLDLKDKVAIVTGCGSSGPGWGNGKAISVLLARRGATVVGIDIHQDAAEETRDLIRSEGGRCEVRSLDVTDAGAVSALVAACARDYPQLDILVNNVGRSEPGGPTGFSEETWKSQLDINLNSAFLMCREVLPHMEARGTGAVVNVSSVAGLRYIGKPQVAYAAAKAALIQFTRTTAVLYAPLGVRLNTVVPGLIDTPLVKRLADKYAAGDLVSFTSHRNQQVPMGTMGSAWDVAHAALFLASDEARYITATELVVDGGFIAATR